jgi:hypothetical protein
VATLDASPPSVSGLAPGKWEIQTDVAFFRRI